MVLIKSKYFKLGNRGKKRETEHWCSSTPMGQRDRVTERQKEILRKSLNSVYIKKYKAITNHDVILTK